MNRSGIEWCDHTWNPITGCLHGCEYCYARRISMRFAGDVKRNKAATGDYQILETWNGRNLYILDQSMLSETGNILTYPFGFEPTLHRYRFDTLEKLKMGNNIFVGAMADIFGEWVPDEWISEIFGICQKYPIHNYLFLTKNPDRYVSLCLKELLPEYKNMWYGVTITNSRQAYTAEAAMRDMPSEVHAFLSIEPILEDIASDLKITIANFTNWVIIGAETGNGKGKIVPKKEWIDSIVKQCDNAKIPVFMKDSLIPIVGEGDMRRKFPKQLQVKPISPKMRNRLYDSCCICKIYQKKSGMLTLWASSDRREYAKQFAYICPQCFCGLCAENKIDLPELVMFKGEKMCFGETRKDT